MPVLVDSQGEYGEIMRDRVTNGLEVLTTDHALIHEGIAYTLANVVTVDTAHSIAFTTPAVAYVHFKPIGITASGGPVTITLKEGATFTGGATATPFNRNRLSTNTADMVCKTGVTTSDGTVLLTALIGSATTGSQKVGASTNAAEEIVLKRNTTYTLNFAETATGTVAIGYDLFWYEEASA